MLFNTFEYFAFFTSVFLFSWLVCGLHRIRIWFILIASFFFYSSNNSWQILILLFTTTVDYIICLKLGVTENERKRKYLLLISLISNLGVLAYFKYVDFFGKNLATALQAFGWSMSWVDLNIALPVGISFYTFEALSYTIDVYRRHIPAEREWNRLAFLVSFFPHLIAGPIVRAADFFPQMNKPARLTYEEFETGVGLIVRGIIKKLFFADTLGYFADYAYGNSASLGFWGAWAGMYAFALQIYFDFSGYSDIAVGSGKLLGYQLPTNFIRPYAAFSITNFWRRWHISLSTWLRDYLYISLGGNRMKSQWGIYRNLMLTMLLGGLWHGAAWNFVIWGGVHGALLSIERFYNSPAKTPSFAQEKGIRRLLRSLFIFHIVALLWVPFRSQDMTVLSNMLISLIDITQAIYPPTEFLYVFLATFLVWLWQFIDEKHNYSRFYYYVPCWMRGIIYAATVMICLIMGSSSLQPFIYFQF